jgi:MOSC domain-containing protein YiiM
MGADQQETVPAGRPEDQFSMHGTVAAVSRNDVYSFTKPVRDEITLVAGLGVAGDVHAGVTVRHRGRVAADPDQPNLRQVHLIRSELHDELSDAGYEVPAGGLGENVTTTGIDLLALPVGTILRFGPLPAREPTAPAEHALAAGPAPVTGSESDARLAGAVPPPDATGSEPAAESAVAAPVATPAGGAAAVVAAAQRVGLDASAAGAVAALSVRVAAEASSGQGETAVPDPRPAIVITGLRNPCLQINHYRPGLLKRVLGREADGSVSRRAGVMAVVLRGGPIRPGTKIDVEFPALPHRRLDRV